MLSLPDSHTCEEVRKPAARVKAASKGLEEAYAVKNNHFRGQAFITRIEEIDALPPEVPVRLVQLSGAEGTVRRRLISPEFCPGHPPPAMI